MPPTSRLLIGRDISDLMSFSNYMIDKMKGSYYTKLKDSPLLAGSQGTEMRELEGAGSPYAPVQVGNGEKGFRDKWAGCVVKRPTTRYRNGGERCKPVRARQTDAMTVSRAEGRNRHGAWPGYVEIACINHI